MPYDINTSLERLEQSLKDIKSAKQQVEQTVATSTELQGIVSGYVSSLDSLLTNVKNWVNEISSFQSSNLSGIEKSIGNIQRSCDKVVENFTSSTGELSTNLKTKITDELGKFESANTKLSSQVEKLLSLDEHLQSTTSAVNSVKEKLVEVLNELKASQKAQDESLDALKKAQDVLSTKTDNIETSCKEISKSLSGASTVIEGIATVVNDSNKEISEIKKNYDANTKIIKSEISKLEEMVSSLNKQIETTREELMKSSKVNRWIVIASFILLVILVLVWR